MTVSSVSGYPFAAGSPQFWSRRQILTRTGCGFGMLGLTGLLQDQGLLQAGEDVSGDRMLSPLAARPSHFPAKAKRVIWIFINGGPSPVDTWNYRPELTRWNGRTIREFDSGFADTTGFFRNAVGNLMQSPFRFEPRGECGRMVPEIFPYLGEHVDRMAIIQSGYTESNNHSPALFAINTGMARMGFPCVGSWVTYGLGSESANLPGFVVMAASDEAELTNMVATARAIDDRPSAFRYPRGEGFGVYLPARVTPLEVGKGRVLREGTKIALLSFGARLHECLTAAEDLADEQVVGAEVVPPVR